MDIGTRIKDLRKNKKLTQKELAKRINKSERMLQKYEAGVVTPSYEVMEDIAEALDITVNNLITDQEASNIAALKDVENLVESFPEHKEAILDITKSVYKIIHAEYLKLPNLKTSETVFEIMKDNLNLYSELFQTIYELSNVGFIVIEAKKENIPKLYSRKNEKIRKINDILEEIFANHMKRHGLSD